MYDIALRAARHDPILNLALEESLLERGFGRDRAILVYVNDPCVVVAPTFPSCGAYRAAARCTTTAAI
jgi:hypothetical protein